MKLCRICLTEKPSEMFYKHKGTADGLENQCKLCKADVSRKRALAKKEGTYERKKLGFHNLPEGMRHCGTCNETKPKELFYVDNSRASGVSVKCKNCADAWAAARRADPEIDHLTVRRKWAEENRERLREQDRIYREANRERMNITEGRRRARKKQLPDTLTIEEVTEIITVFDSKCALCESEYEHLDHFIPLSSGHGGTTRENTVPLCAQHNASKHGRNPFVWAETLPSDERERFRRLVDYLTVINGIASVEDYEAHVHQCFK